MRTWTSRVLWNAVTCVEQIWRLSSTGLARAVICENLTHDGFAHWKRRRVLDDGRFMTDPPQQDVYVDDPRLDVAPFIPQNAGPVLDIGCGKGCFGRTLRDALGPEVRIVGIEANERQAAVARSDHGYDEVIHGYYPQAIEGDTTKFETVFFLDRTSAAQPTTS